MNRTLSMVVLAAGLAAVMVLAGAARTQAASTTIGCSVGQDAVCQVGDSDGLLTVRVTLQTGQGPLVVVDESYTCPNTTSDSVAWDPVVPGYEIVVEDCGGQIEGGFGFGASLHRALGDAQLRRDGPNLIATGFDGEGDDGVLVETGEASKWEGLLLPAEPTAEGGFEAAIFGDDLVAPQSTIQFSKYMTDVIVYPTPSYDGAPYGVQLFMGDEVVYEQSNIPGGTSEVGFVQWFCQGISEAIDCAPRLAFGLDVSSGLWYWELALPNLVDLQTPNGRLQADRLRFNEEGAGGDGPPRSFRRVEMGGRNLPFLSLFGAEIRGPLPASSLALPMVVHDGEPDPFGLQALTEFLEASTPPSDVLRINDSLTVEVIGPGDLVEEPVEEPEPGGEPRGVPDPDEPPAEDVPVTRQALRVFNTANEMEYEIVVEGPLLEQIDRLRGLQGATGAMPGMDGLGADGLVGWLRPRVTTGEGDWYTPGGPEGWSGGVDNRNLLTYTTWWPWRTIVHFSNNCSGVLVGPRHILTAAHCINQRATNNWYSFTVTPGRNGDEKPYGDSQMNPNPQPGDPFRWYFTPAQWRSSAYNSQNCPGSCYAATEWDWGLIIIPDYLGYQTGWMGYVARPAGQLNVQAHFNRGYPWCGTSNNNEPANCQPGSLYGDAQLCTMGNYLFQGGDSWNRVIRNSCDLSGGHSGSPVYHYFYDAQIGKVVPVAAMVEVWEHCYTCGAGDTTPNSARRLTPNDLNVISFFRQWKP